MYVVKAKKQFIFWINVNFRFDLSNQRNVEAFIAIHIAISAGAKFASILYWAENEEGLT